MAKLVVDERDQDFVLYEMLDIESLCRYPKFQEFSRDLFEMTLDVARKLAEEEVYPAAIDGDREGCRLENGQVYVPKCYHRLHKLVTEGGWTIISTSPESGGQGFPYTMYLAANEGFMHNFAYFAYPGIAAGAAHLIEVYGTEEQKRKYMDKMYAGEWGGSMALTEPDAGSDVGSLKTKAVRQPDGTYRLSGSKIFITSADSDLYENIVHPVLARIEGDPAGTKGISIFLVPKFLVNEDGSPGERNDFVISGIEHKMGIRGSSTCAMSFGDNGNCYAELLGEERKGMRIMFQLMNEARIAVGIQGLGGAATAYMHALDYAKERKQGSSLLNMQNPEAPRVSIIEHPDVRRMLLWMKSHVDGMRAMVYYAGNCVDRAEAMEEGDEAEKLKGIIEILTPVIKSYCSDIGFRITEVAMQVYGGYGYTQDYPVEQFMRDIKIASIYEGTNGIQALDLVGRKMGQNKGKNFMMLLSEISSTVEKYRGSREHGDLAEELDAAKNIMAEVGMFFAKCGKEGKYLIPVSNAYPYLNLVGTVVLGWMLFWQSGIAVEKLDTLVAEKGISRDDPEAFKAFLDEDSDAAYYSGKVHAARYYIKNVLPQVKGYAEAIKSEDLSVIGINDKSF